MTKNRASKITAQILWALVVVLAVVLAFRWPEKPISSTASTVQASGQRS